MIAKLTKAVVDRLRLNSVCWDETVRGFGCRKQRRDAFYVLRYRINGKQRLVSIGRHGSPWTVELARREAQRLLGQVVSGIDPAPKREEIDDDRANGSFGSILDGYLERRRSVLRERSFEEMERHLRVQCQPLHTLNLKDITRRTIAHLLADVEAKSGPISRNRVRTSLSAFFNFCIREGLADLNPVTGTAVADEGPSRDRVLSETELRTLWQSLDQSEFSDICRLLILTAQRRTEIGGLKWSEIDFENSVICFPPSRTKNRKAHSLPMSRQVKTVLERRRLANLDRRHPHGMVFGSEGVGFVRWSEAKDKLDARLNGEVKPYRLHDFRRTCATLMADKLEVQPHHIEAVLNHISGSRAGVAGIYVRAKYQDQMKDALDRWGEYVDGLTA